MGAILGRVIAAFGVSEDQLRNGDRRRHIVDARRAFALAAFKASYTVAQIATYLSADLSSVNYWVRSGANRVEIGGMGYDKEFHARYVAVSAN